MSAQPDAGTFHHAAAQALYAALKMMPCRCQHNVPYPGCQVEQVVTAECARCSAIKRWEKQTIKEL